MEELDMVSGGMEISEDGQAGGRCPDCGTLLVKVDGVWQCPGCTPKSLNSNANKTQVSNKNSFKSGGRSNRNNPLGIFTTGGRYNA